MDKQLRFAIKFAKDETNRITDEVLKTNRLTRQDMDILNRILEVFADRIKEQPEWNK